MQSAEQTTNEIVQAAWDKRPLIISGPCSAETEDQVLATAQRLAATGKVDMLRAGILIMLKWDWTEIGTVIQ